MRNIVQLFAYDDWATTELLNAVQSLTPQQFALEFDGTSVREQFAHLLSVTDRYRARLAHEVVPDGPPQLDAPDDLISYHGQMRERLQYFVSQITKDQLQNVVEHATRSGVFRATFGETLQHMINHATYHRGQIACLMKRHGADFPDTDFILWLNQTPL